MDAYTIQTHREDAGTEQIQAPEVTQWLMVSGDLDDFIYFGEEARHSEK